MKVVHAIRGCNRVQPLLDSYVSNELLVETNHEILRHLGECRQCSATLDSRLAARDLLRRASAATPVPPGLAIRVQENLRGVTVIPRKVRPNWPMLATIAAGLALLILAGLNRPNRDPVLTAGWNNHLHCTLAGHFPDQPPNDETMIEKLGPKHAGLLEVVRREMSGYRVRQAHRCTTVGRKFAHVILQKDTVLLSISVAERLGGESLPQRMGMRSSVIQGVEVTGFEAGAFLVFVSSNQGRADNLRVAAALAPGIRDTLKPRSASVRKEMPITP